MRGFARRSTVEQAWRWLDAQPAPLASEDVPLDQLAGRVLARQVTSSIHVPPFDRAMMDGFALRGAETQGACAYNVLELPIVGSSLPGRPFQGELGPGQAVRIMTGAPLPRGGDAVLPAEAAEFSQDRLRVLGEVPPGKHVGPRGEDIVAGAVVLEAGRQLRPQDVGVLASIGCTTAACTRRPVVKIVVTGEELVPPGAPLGTAQVYDANGPMLRALVARDGGIPLAVPLVPDDPDALLAALRDPPADVVLVSGGSSVGEEDHAPQLLARHGELAIHGVAMRPSSPTGMGKLDGRLVFLLPGNPVSCLCAYDFFAGRAIRALGGRGTEWPYPRARLPLARKLSSPIGRVDYARVVVESGLAVPLSVGGASVLTTTTRADGFVMVPGDSEGYPAGAEVDVFIYDAGKSWYGRDE
jgi:molybdopterin molybdotransferase